MEIVGNNYNEVAPQIYSLLESKGIPRNSRNGLVKYIDEPVTITVTRPWQRVNFSVSRDANPFFHLMEGLAMLADFNDAHFLAYFAKNMLSFSDDGQRYNAFYGSRIRRRWEDQLAMVIKELRANPDSRQCVVQIWDPVDLRTVTKDKACNLLLMFAVDANGALKMTSVNRSNDAIWGICTGANIVHLSMFQEYVALALGRAIGPWSHITNNLHVYTDNEKWPLLRDTLAKDEFYRYYGTETHYPLFEPSAEADKERDFDFAVRTFVGWAAHAARNPDKLILDPHSHEFLRSKSAFIADTAIPVFVAWHMRKVNRLDTAVEWLDKIEAHDWRIACQQWVSRRLKS